MALSKLGALPGATVLFAPSLVFGLIAIAGWARLLDALLPESDARLERLLLMAVFVLHPGVLSTVLQPNVDVATLAWGMWMLDGVARGSVVQVALAGGLVAWSKESGVALYGAASLVTWLYGRARGFAVRDSRREAVREATVLLAPVLLLAAFLIVPLLRPAEARVPMWTDGSMGVWGLFMPFDLWNRHLLNFGILIFVLQFQWVATVGLVIAAAWRLRTLSKFRESWKSATVYESLKSLVVESPARRVFWAVLLGWYVVTSYRTFGNIRYFALLLPLVPLAAVLLARRGGVRALVPRVALLAWLPLLVAAQQRSVDPVTAAITGTFSVGRGHSMYDMTRRPMECCGRGRDQLVYSLEYTSFPRVMDFAMESLRPSDTTAFVMSLYADAAWLTPLDAVTSRRTLSTNGTVMPPIFWAESLAVGADGPSRGWFIDAPNVDPTLESLAWRYRRGAVRDFTAGTMRVRFVELTEISGARRAGTQ